MITSRTYSARGALVALAISLVLSILIAFASGSAQAGSSSTGCSGAYGWPVKPFDRPHPIRGSFGDPRTIFHGPPTRETLVAGDGRFSFHQGVDISAPDGSPIYAVAGGTVVDITHERITIDCGNGRAFEYWHLESRVRVGQRVTVATTLVGTVRRPQEHVHLTQLENGHAVNPVAPGRLSPYRDATPPRVLDIVLRQSETGPDEMPQFVRGRITMLAEAVDTPALPVPGIWHRLPVTPARVSWHIEKWTGRIVVGEHVARDVRESLPSNAAFWATFARGTCQNMSVFGHHYSYLEAGRYLFKLSAQPFDTRTVRDGVYELVVTAQDIAGNHDVRRLRFTVHNREGWR